MTNKEINERAATVLTTDDADVINKKSITAADVSSALFENNTKSPEQINTPVFRSIGILIFSFLLIVSGIMTAVLLSFTVIGLIVGIALVIAGVVLPFVLPKK